MEYPSMYHAATEYIKLGLAVFPLEEKGKRPKTKNGCKDATTDEAHGRLWFGRGGGSTRDADVARCNRASDR